MKKRINRALAYLLTLAMALALLPAITPPPASAGVGDTWTSCGGVPWTVGSSYSGSWTFTSANNNDRTTAYEMTGTGGTLMVSSGVIYLVFNNYIGGARMTVAAGAHAVVFLPDGTVNAVINGVNVPPGATLTIEGGARGTGTLTAVCTSGAAGIGGNHLQSSGTINILG
ncbi:MAG: hypothetical protein LBT12_04055, partial [Oscillospiraceae bacterium]|nr:hypothetical protein [Oscillospiraceae bacterium]